MKKRESLPTWSIIFSIIAIVLSVLSLWIVYSHNTKIEKNNEDIININKRVLALEENKAIWKLYEAQERAINDQIDIIKDSNNSCLDKEIIEENLKLLGSAISSLQKENFSLAKKFLENINSTRCYSENERISSSITGEVRHMEAFWAWLSLIIVIIALIIYYIRNIS